jgi:predicted permease
MREAGVRVALGAGRLRVMTPFLAEALLLAAVGAVVGTGLAYEAVHLFDRATDPAMTGRPYFVRFVVDVPVLLFAVGVTGLTALMAGAAPAFQVGRADVNEILKDESRGSSSLRAGRLGKVLVMVEVAFSVALLVAAGLVTRTIAELRAFQLPFDPTAYATGRITLFDTDYPTRETRQRYWTDAERSSAATPGVAGAALAAGVPGVGSGMTRIRLEGKTYEEPTDRPMTHAEMVTPSYFPLLDAEVLAGQTFGDQHTHDAAPVAVVNRSVAQRFWPGESALGRRFRTGTADTIPWLTVIGVVEDLQMQGFQPAGSPGAIPDGYYVPVAQNDPTGLNLIVRAAGSGKPAALLPALRETLHELDPDVPIFDVRTIQESAERSRWLYSVFGSVFIAFGLVAVFMASVGLYGVLAFSVSRRTQEIGIRMALGAGRREVLGLVLRQGLTQIGVGLGVGLLAAAGLSGVLKVVLFHVQPRDPWVFGGVILLVLAVGVVASLVPAGRATAVDPSVALRSD